MDEIALLADLAVGSRLCCCDLGPLICPQIEGKKAATQLVLCAGEQLECLGYFDRSGQIDRRVENSRRVASFHSAAGWFGKNAGETGRFTGKNVHGDGVGADGCGVDPGLTLLDCIVIEKVASLEIVGGVENQICAAKEFVNILRDQVCYLRTDVDFTV